MVQVNVRGIVGASIPVVSIIIIFITMFSNSWYTIDYNGEGRLEDVEMDSGNEIDEMIIHMDVEATGGLSEWETDAKMKSTLNDPTLPGGKVSDEKRISETEDFEGDEKKVGTITLIFLIISLVLIFGFMVVGILGGLGIIPGYIPMIIGFIAIAVLLFAIIYYPIAFPPACEKETKKSLKEEDWSEENQKEWGRIVDELLDTAEFGWCYYLTIGALVVLLPGPLMFIGIKKAKKRSSRDDRPPAMGYPSDSYDQPPRREDYYEDRRRDDYYNRDRRDYPPY